MLSDTMGYGKISNVYKNLNEIDLVEEAIKNCEGKLGKGGSLIVFTGEKTGRSPKDKHVVKEKHCCARIMPCLVKVYLLPT